MGLLQTTEATPHPTKMRAIAYELALKDGREHGAAFDIKRAIDHAKEIERYLWGGFAPIERPPTPLNTIEETIEHLRKQLNELGSNSPGTKAADVLNLLPMVERISADLESILKPQT